MKFFHLFNLFLYLHSGFLNILPYVDSICNKRKGIHNYTYSFSLLWSYKVIICIVLLKITPVYKLYHVPGSFYKIIFTFLYRIKLKIHSKKLNFRTFLQVIVWRNENPLKRQLPTKLSLHRYSYLRLDRKKYQMSSCHKSQPLWRKETQRKRGNLKKKNIL